MPTVNESTILESGGDYTTLALCEADTDNDLVTADVQEVMLLGRNTVEDVTLAGSTTDATRNRVIKSYFGNNLGRTGLYSRKDCVYGAIVITNEYADVEDIGLAHTTSTSAILRTTGTSQITVNVRRVWLKTSSAAGHGLRWDNSHASSVHHSEACVMMDGTGSGDGVLAGASTGTTESVNDLAFNCRNGFNHLASTFTAKNSYAVRCSGVGFDTPAITCTTCAATDTTATSRVTEAQWVRRVASLSTLKSYWTGENEPTAAPGKLAQAAWRRVAGSTYGALGGDAAISGGSLTGTTGGLTFAERAMSNVDSLCGAVKATMPATPASRGLMQLKASGDSNNRIDFFIDASGNLSLAVYNSSGSVDHTLAYTPVGDNLAGTHEYGWRVSGGSSYLYLDGVEIATVADAVTRDATDTLALAIGVGSTFFLGVSGSCSASVTATGSAAPPRLPMALYADGTGALDDFALRETSSATLKGGGTDSGAPDLDASGQSFQNPPSIGAHQFIPTASGDPSNIGAHGLFGHHALHSYGGNSGFLSLIP